MRIWKKQRRHLKQISINCQPIILWQGTWWTVELDVRMTNNRKNNPSVLQIVFLCFTDVKCPIGSSQSCSRLTMPENWMYSPLLGNFTHCLHLWRVLCQQICIRMRFIESHVLGAPLSMLDKRNDTFKRDALSMWKLLYRCENISRSPLLCQANCSNTRKCWIQLRRCQNCSYWRPSTLRNWNHR